MSLRKTLFTCLAGALLAPFVLSGETITTPAPGSPERKALLDAVRVPAEAKLKQSVVFQVNVLNLRGNDAFAVLKPVQAATRAPIDWTQTEFAEEVRAEVFSGEIVVLLKKKAGVWQIVEMVWGPSDVCWETWPQQYSLPEALFAYPK